MDGPFEPIALLSSIIVALATSWATVKLSLRQFYSQKWWELRLEIYNDLMEKLFHTYHHATTLYEVALAIKPAPENMDELTELSLKGMEALEKYIAIGSFSFEQKIVDELKILKRKTDAINPERYLEALEKTILAYKETIDKIVPLLKKDLKNLNVQ